MGAESTAFGMFNQPHSEGSSGYRIRMTKLDSKAVLWHNVSTLMRTRYGKENLTKMASEASIGPATASRIKEQRTSVGVDVLDALAALFKVEPWQLLLPELQAAQRKTLTAWPFSIEPGKVRELPPDAIGKIEAYIQSKLDDVAADDKIATNRKQA